MPMRIFGNALLQLRRWFRRRMLREGSVHSRFIARDIRREVLVVSTARIDEGIITGCVRTTNVLYLAKGLTTEPGYGPATELRINEMWNWTGESWGGLADGTSTVKPMREHHPKRRDP